MLLSSLPFQFSTQYQGKIVVLGKQSKRPWVDNTIGRCLQNLGVFSANLSVYRAKMGKLDCSACTPYNHDKKRCVGCRHTGHNRSNCPFPYERTQAMPRTAGIPQFQSQNQLNQPVFALQLSRDQGLDGGLEVIPGTQY